MQIITYKYRCGSVIIASVFALLLSGKTSANGTIGDHVNDLQGHLNQYAEEVDWLLTKVDGIVHTYEYKGQKAAHADAVVEHWEAIDFHTAIETTYVPVYATIWQRLFGVKQAIDEQAPIAKVRDKQAKLEQSLWQALGAVKLAAQYQQKGLLAEIQTTESEPTTPSESLEDIKHRLDQVVAKYAEQLPNAAKTIVHDTYQHRFESIEGTLIAQNAALAEDLEKDFHVTLPQALDRNASVDEVRNVVLAMQAKLAKAKSLLMQAEKKRKDIF